MPIIKQGFYLKDIKADIMVHNKIAKDSNFKGCLQLGRIIKVNANFLKLRTQIVKLKGITS